MNDHLATTNEFTEAVLWTMKEIQKEALATPNDRLVYFAYENAPTKPTVEDQRRAVRYLEKNKALKIVSQKYPIDIMSTVAEMYGMKIVGTYLNIQPSFGLFLQELGAGKVKSATTSFDQSTSILCFADHSIEISKNKNTDAHYLLTILSEEMSRDWACDEIWESDFFRSGNREYDPTEDWKKIYNAGASVNTRIEKATQIKDFLKVTKTSVSINKKYLNRS